MGDRDVHAIGIIVADILPVHRAWAKRDAPVGNEVFEFAGGEFIGVGRRHVRDARQAAFEAHEDEAVGDFLIDGLEAESLRIEAFEALPFRRPGEGAVELIAPGVIGADEALSARATRLAGDYTGAVAADI